MCRDGRVMTVSYETSELHYIILCQVRGGGGGLSALCVPGRPGDDR